jgi:hypothetical protein
MPDRDPLQTLWTQQTQETFSMSLADIHAHSRRFRSRIRIRNLTEYAAAALVVAVFGWMAFLIPDLVVKAGCILTALGAVYVAYALHEKAGTFGGRPEGAEPLLDYHRAELLRQRQALATVPRWYLAPFVPGILIFIGGVSFAPDTGLPLLARLSQFGISLAIVSAVFAGVAWLNVRAVKQLDAEIAAIDAAGAGE